MAHRACWGLFLFAGGRWRSARLIVFGDFSFSTFSVKLSVGIIVALSVNGREPPGTRTTVVQAACAVQRPHRHTAARPRHTAARRAHAAAAAACSESDLPAASCGALGGGCCGGCWEAAWLHEKKNGQKTQTELVHHCAR